MEIYLKDRSKVFHSVEEIRAYFYDRLNDDLFQYIEKDRIVSDFLNFFELPSFEKREGSVEAICTNFLKEHKIPYDGKGVDFFFHSILDFESIPSVMYLDLLKEANDDLQKVDFLIDDYRKENIIKRYTQNPNEHPRNHTEKTILDFYLRTVEKKKKIEEYIATEVNRIAIEESRNKNRLTWPLIKDKDWLTDYYLNRKRFPYRDDALRGKFFVRIIDYERLDYRKINLWRHKNEVFRFTNDISDENVTKSLENEIDEKYNVSDRLSQLCEEVRDIPIISERQEIFEDLKRSYSSGAYYSFYALAIVQIEGIFTEVLRDALFQNISGKALPDKVKLFKGVQNSTYNTLDYFEYKFPEYRNKFTHLGKDDNIEFKCKTILLDLDYIVNACVGMDIPLMRIKRFIQNTDLEKTSIISFAEFLHDIKDVQKNKGADYLKNVLLDFQGYISNQFITYFNTSHFFENLEKDWITAYQEFQLFLCEILLENNEDFQLDLSMEDFVQKFKGIDVTKAQFYLIMSEQFTFLIKAIDFLKTINTTISISENLKTKIKEILNRQDESIKRINYLKISITPENLRDTFLYTKNVWKHFLS